MLIEKAIESLKFDIRGKKVLEVGCGTCVFCNAAAKIASEVYAIDIENKTKFIVPQANLFFKLNDATKMDFRPNSFDTVVLYDTVGYLERDIERVIDECLRVLKQDGVILLCSSMSYDRAVLDKKALPYLQTLDVDIKLSMYQTMKTVRITKGKKIGYNYRELKEKMNDN